MRGKSLSTRFSILIGKPSSDRPLPPQQAEPVPEPAVQGLEQVLGYFYRKDESRIRQPDVGELEQQRIDMMMCSDDMCQRLGLPWKCQEYQITLYGLLRTQHPQSTKDSADNNRLMLVASLLVACRQLNTTQSTEQLLKPLIDMFHLNQGNLRMLNLLMDELALHVLPKFSTPLLITTPLEDLFVNLNETDRIILKFIVQLRYNLNTVYRLKSHQQLICCIGTTEFLLSSRFHYAWEIMEEMRKRGMVGDREHAEIRCGIRTLVSSIVSISWETSSWTWRWLSRHTASDATLRDSVAKILSSVVPLVERPLNQQPSLIWLMAPSTLV